MPEPALPATAPDDEAAGHRQEPEKPRMLDTQPRRPVEKHEKDRHRGADDYAERHRQKQPPYDGAAHGDLVEEESSIRHG